MRPPGRVCAGFTPRPRPWQSGSAGRGRLSGLELAPVWPGAAGVLHGKLLAAGARLVPPSAMPYAATARRPGPSQFRTPGHRKDPCPGIISGIRKANCFCGQQQNVTTGLRNQQVASAAAYPSDRDCGWTLRDTRKSYEELFMPMAKQQPHQERLSDIDAGGSPLAGKGANPVAAYYPPRL